MDAPAEAIQLSYPVPSFKNAGILLAVALLLALSWCFLGKAELIGYAGALMLIVGIQRTLFVLNFRFFEKKIGFDEANLYMLSRKHRQVIALKDIVEIRFYSNNRGTMGYSHVFLIDYLDGNQQKETEMTIFRKMRPAFDDFVAAVKEQNPRVTYKASNVL